MFIRLTNKDGSEVFINSDSISSFFISKEPCITRIDFAFNSNEYWLVKETQEEIYEKLQEV